MPLSGNKVLDLTHYRAGPYCTKFLAGLGAEVVKIEKPGEGDGARKLGPFYEDVPQVETGIPFLYLNMGKKGITLNLKSEKGKEIFRTLVKQVDMVVESFEPRVMPSLGLDYESLNKINPRLVEVSISNFGQTGPYKDFKAYENVLQALGGVLYMIGPYDRAPVQLPFLKRNTWLGQ